MKRLFNRVALICLALLVAWVATGFAGGADDGEEALRARLVKTAGTDAVAQFDWADYDGDGMREAFAIVSDAGWGDDGIEGEIWFVSPTDCARIHARDSYLSAGRLGVGPCLYAAEIWYGGSGSASAVWGVSGSAEAVALEGSGFEGLSAGDVPNEFYMYPSAFDACADGTGHTWKRYYFFLNGLRLLEYGGLAISRAELEAAPGAAAILAAAEADGWRVGEIWYRANGVINVNLTDGDMNDNLTLRCGGDGVVDTGERYGGVYLAQSGLAQAVYPKDFQW